MRFLRTGLTGVFLLVAVCTQAAGEVEITFLNGAKRVVDELVVQSGKIILAKENLSVPFSQIVSVDFTFEQPLTSDECDGLLKRGEYSELVSRLDSFLAPVNQFLALPGNLDVYIQYKMRACFWSEKFDDARAMAQILESKKSSYAPLAGLYNVAIMLEQEQPAEEVSAAFDKIQNPDATSGAIAEYIRGRLAVSARQYESALQHFSNVLVVYSRDREWVPAATFQEGLIYKRTGYLESAENVAKELKIAYPDGSWSRRAGELK